MTTKVIGGTVVDINGAAIADAEIHLTLPVDVVFRVGDDASVASKYVTSTNGSGAWTLTVECNDTLTPTGTLYQVREVYPASRGFKIYLIQVLSTLPGGTNQVLDLLVPEMSPIGIINNFLTKAYADTLYAPISGGSGGTGGVVQIADGVTDTILTTVKDLVNSNPIMVAIADANGDQVTSFGGGTQYTEDAASPADPVGITINFRRRDTLATETSASGDWTIPNVTGKGELYVKQTDSVTVIDGGGSLTVDGTVSIAGAVPVTDNSSSLTVDAPVGSPVFVRLSDGASPISALPITDNAGSLTVDGTVSISGTVDTELPAAAALADNVANPTVPGVGSFGMVWDSATWDRMTQPLTDTQLRASAVPISVSGSLPAGTNNIGDVDVVSMPAGSADGTILDGVSSSIKVTVFDLTNSNPLAVRLTDASGNTMGNTGNGVATGAQRVTIASDSTGVIGVGSVTPGTGATNLGKAEDAVHTTADVGVMALGVRNDAGTAFAADGDYVPLSIDAAGAVRVTGGGGGTQYTEDAVAAADPVGTVPILVRKDTPAATVSADADNIAQRGSNYGAAYVTLLDSAGGFVSVGGGTQYTEDAVAATDPIGTAEMLVRQDTPATLVSANGDNVARRGTNYGAAYAQIVTSTGSFVDSFGGGTQYTEDAVPPADPTGPALMLRRDDNGDDSVSADGDWISAHADANGNLRTNISSALPAGTNNIGDVDVLTLPSIPAGTNNIGDVDVLSVVPGTGATNLGKAGDAVAASTDTGVQALAVRSDTGTKGLVSADGDYAPLTVDSTGLLKVNVLSGTVSVSGSVSASNFGSAVAAADNMSNPTTAQTIGMNMVWDGSTWDRATGDSTNGMDVDVTRLPSIPAGTNNIGDVDVLTLPALPAGTNNIGDVDVLTLPNVTLAAGTNTNEVVGDAAEDAALAGNPVRMGVRAHNGVPTAMSANDEVVTPWGDRSGAIAMIPQPRMVYVTATPTISTSGYVANDQVGGKLTFSNAALASGRPVAVVQAMLTSRTVVSNEFTLYLCQIDPTLAGSDNAAADLTDANTEAAQFVPAVKFIGTDYDPLASNTMCPGTLFKGPVSTFLIPTGGTSIFGFLKATTVAGQYGGTTDLVISLWLQQY